MIALRKSIYTEMKMDTTKECRTRKKRTWVIDRKISNTKQMCERTGKLTTTRATLVRIPYLDQWEPPELLQTERKCRFTPWQQGPVLAVLEVPTMCWTTVNSKSTVKSKSAACIKSGFAFIVSFHALCLICLKHMHEKNKHKQSEKKNATVISRNYYCLLTCCNIVWSEWCYTF